MIMMMEVIRNSSLPSLQGIPQERANQLPSWAEKGQHQYNEEEDTISTTNSR